MDFYPVKMLSNWNYLFMAPFGDASGYVIKYLYTENPLVLKNNWK